LADLVKLLPRPSRPRASGPGSVLSRTS
jgi:hypothetical protein